MDKRVLALLALGSAGLSGKPMLGQSQPNFVVIVTDDQTFESIGCLNNGEVRTPNLDRLVNGGTVFTHAFNQGAWSGAVSVASRTMLVTGQYLWNAAKNVSCYRNDKKDTQIESKRYIPLWGEVFRQAGYETFMTGKWHNSDEALLKSFDRAKAVGGGMYESRPSGRKELTQYNRPAENKAWQPDDSDMGGHWQPVVRDIVYVGGDRVVGAKYRVDKHTSELYGEEAVRYLQQYDRKKPFFAYVAFNAPHDPRQSPEKYVDMYPRDKIRIPGNFLAEHPFDQGDCRIRDEKLAPFPRTEEAVRLHRQEYYAMITHVDKVVGDILNELECSGRTEDTYIIFTSDHGLAVGKHGLMGKQNQYDHSVRVPLIICGPGIKAGARADGLVYMQSLYATTCELAGIPVPETIDFMSLVPQLKRTSISGEKYIFGCYRNLQRMIRTERYKLIVYPQAGRLQLFDMKKDTDEMSNLAENKKYRKKLYELFMQLKQLQRNFNDTADLGMFENYK